MTPTPIDLKDCERIKKYCDEAGHTPWEVTQGGYSVYAVKPLKLVCWCANNKKTRTAGAKSDALFIAQSRTDLPRIVEQHGKLLKELCDVVVQFRKAKPELQDTYSIKTGRVIAETLLELCGLRVNESGELEEIK